MSSTLPPAARRFLASKGRPASHDPYVVRGFHSWLERSGRHLSRLDAAGVRSFLASSRFRSLQPRSQLNHRRRLLRYLDWLFATRQLAFDPDCLRLHARRLAPLAEEFLAVIRTTHKPTTCICYASALRKFYRWLARSRRDLAELDRRAMSSWLVELQRQRLHPKSRVNVIQSVRIYLRWLRDHGLVKFDPDDLIRSRDLPKLPDYLPRPLPPEADRQLQARLAACDSDYGLGLLLMRRTGLRIGELRDLEFDPLRTDPSGQVYLKVPLGKLDNERLVPVDDQTHRLVRTLQSRGDPNRRWLIATASGEHTRRRVNFNQLLRQACDGLAIPEAINTHRLRHTYASSLLSAGISLVALMRLLGHRDFHMTLRYAAITPEVIRTEFDQALHQLENRYRVAPPEQPPFEPLKVLSDLIRWTQNALAKDQPGQVRGVVKRLRRLRADLQPLLRTVPG